VSWSLVNVEVRADLHDNFLIPSRADREALVFGDFAKLIFLEHQAADWGERMWVIVRKKLDDGRYEGELDSDPATVNVECGAMVTFGPEHVCAIDRGKTLASVFEREASDAR